MASETGDDTAYATAYPPTEKYEEWKEQADDLGMSVSEYMTSMIEAGRKQWDAVVEPDETNADLRSEVNDLRRELRHERERVEQLEAARHRGERGAVIEYVEENPGATYPDILQHLSNNATDRLTRLLERLEGEELVKEEGEYFRSGGPQDE